MDLKRSRGEGWEVWQEPETHRICACFTGHLGADAGASSAERFVALIGTEPFEACFDVTAMSGYDSAARGSWKDALWPRRALIRSIIVTGGNALVRMGAQILGMALGVPVRTRSGEAVDER
jgi:hypothetical protein